ncbi:permease [Roseovarius sp. EL26]|uniref:permease n=1 Tax=Roseovarius sp. EL26 TaxID=2126672 RepID=UPI000EA0655D|nr:permease [Roseovarius sp. EL26]
MTDQTCSKPLSGQRQWRIGILFTIFALCVMIWPGPIKNALIFSLWGLIQVAPMVVPGIIVAAWIIASGADTLVRKAFEGRTLATVLTAAAIGAITPVCGVTVLPLMVGLLAAGVPLAPIMAFWLSSPVTDPAMLATTAATLGMPFALGKTIGAFGLGIFGGTTTALFLKKSWYVNALRNNSLSRQLSTKRCSAIASYNPRIWTDPARRQAFKGQALATLRLILICLIPAFAAEYALNAAITPGALANYVGKDQWWAIPAAVFVGAPAYIDGYAALPLTRALIDNGMSAGAAMAFLISGGVVSIWGAMAIAPVLRLKPFLLYLALAVTGSLAIGYVFEWTFG